MQYCTVCNAFFAGRKGKTSSLAAKRAGCDFCVWFMIIQRPGAFDAYPGEPFKGVALELDCSFDKNNRYKAKNCPRLLRNTKDQFNKEAHKLGINPDQYVNTPSCDGTGESFPERCVCIYIS